MLGAPSVIHSAIILAAPAACVTQMASAIQKPRTSLDSPSSDPPSGVKENNPFMPRSILVFCSAGRSLRASSHRSEEHTSELQSRQYLVCRLLLEKKNGHSAETCSGLQLSALCNGA